MRILLLMLALLAAPAACLADVPCEWAVCEGFFIRADADQDGFVDVTDAIATLQFLSFGTPLVCQRAADSNDDGESDITDPTYTLNYLFLGGPPPAMPFPIPGSNPCHCVADAVSPAWCPLFTRPGDVNNDGFVNEFDLGDLFDFLSIGVSIGCVEAGDVDGDQDVDVVDHALLELFLFAGGQPPIPGAPACWTFP